MANYFINYIKYVKESDQELKNANMIEFCSKDYVTSVNQIGDKLVSILFTKSEIAALISDLQDMLLVMREIE